ncbi:MAG: hypothetical protein COX19_12165 [Desulfobacterales bacterium CG23_combo_of_CG06-09_8_20_14_all_51_8]|nr:MAG: hypothetical protein COX19_12165 [Desulfobacterales bacterium CG23_combo_of_CG06-09_8_20_14_all_51_8]
MACHIPAEMFKQMEAPDFYPHPVTAVEVRETHISKVFLAGDFVYKIKKSLNLGFLDFTTLEKRKYFCHQEVVLNRRLAPDVYLDVVSICLENGAYHLGGPGAVVEYAVKMRRLPDTCAMAHRLETVGIRQAEILALADVLAKFYARPEDQHQVEGVGTWEVVSNNCAENFIQTARFAGKLFDERLFKIVRSATLAFLQRRRPLFDKRAGAGKVRDCHGDLRADHIYFTGDGVQIIDCIEFNQRFRYEDVASDLAFLAMDLDARGHSEIAQDLLTEYVRRSGDADLFVLIDFYKSYRAMVRFKISCIRVQEPDVGKPEKIRLESDISHYLNLAYGYAVGFTRPALWVVCGMPASGKSTIATELGRAFGISVLQSDAIRKQHFASLSGGLSPLAFESGIYSRGATALTYGRMFLLAQAEIEKGNSVVLDATFSARRFRDEALRLATDMDANIFFVECVAPDDVMKMRLAHRETRPSLSDARLTHFDAFRKGFEPLDDIRPDQRIIVQTENPVEDCMGRILYNEYIASPGGSRPGVP